MRKLLLILSAIIILASCNSINDGKNESGTILSFSTDVENVDSLAVLIPNTWKNLNTITDTLAHSGKYSSKIDSINEFSIVYENRLGNINDALPKKMKISAFGCSLAQGSNAFIICSVNNNKYYSGAQVDSLFTNTNEWKEISAEFNLPETLDADDIIKAYVWNKKIGTFLVDDLKVELTY